MWSRGLLIGSLATGGVVGYDGPGSELVLRTFRDIEISDQYTEWAEVICQCDCCCDKEITDDFDRERRQYVPANDPCPNDIIIAVDTSFCNDKREKQIRQTVASLVNAYADKQDFGIEPDQLRVALVTFDSDVQVLYGFDEYERNEGFQSEHLNNLLTRARELSVQNEVTDFNSIFDELEYKFTSSFRADSLRSLIIYTNGKEFDNVDYTRIGERFDRMDIDTYGMAFSPFCNDQEKDDPNHVCPDESFFNGVFGSNIFPAPDQATLQTLVRETASMSCPPVKEDDQNRNPNGRSSNGNDGSVTGGRCNECSCDCPFPIRKVPGKQGNQGPTGRSGPDGQMGQKGRDGEPGQPGRKGDQGPPGLAGPMGDRGRQGAAGERGDRGDPGEPGQPGRKGQKGEPGPPAPTSRSAPGAPGRQGEQGRKGERGPEGPEGEPGAPGAPGQPGLQGRKGPAGLPGADGNDAFCDDGVKGPDGPPGVPGLNGKPGADGQPGSPGNPGAKGAKGLPGVMGPTGDRGAPGEPGERGRDGNRGENGKTGINGPPGPVGDPGEAGKDGLKGRKGDQGDSGNDGNPGAKGEKGQPGADGQKGEDGCNGSSGCLGLRGAPGADGNPGEPGLDGVAGAKGGPGCPGERGDIGPPGTPGIIDEFEIHAMVVRAMRELHEECFGEDDEDDDDDDDLLGRPDARAGPSINTPDWFPPGRGDIDENI